MKRSEFSRLPVMNENFTDNRLGQKFLYGNAMVKQLEDKKIGDMITYYLVTDEHKSGNVSYEPVIELLEKD